MRPLHFKILTSPPASRKAKGRISDASPPKRGLSWTTRYELHEPMAALCHAQRVIRAPRHWLGSAITRLGCMFPRDHAASSKSRFSFCTCLTTAQKKSSMHAPAITSRQALLHSTPWYGADGSQFVMQFDWEYYLLAACSLVSVSSSSCLS